MDTNSSGEDVLLKTRKPYTITKQRERWSEEEHNRFLEALKLYGRAWQRIEEHVGTKTAVQIRSHAQKFFTKLEKEALIKGVPVGQPLDIDIPPPRPKRKPSNPYPRKTGFGAPPIHQVGPKDGKHLTSVCSFIRCKPILDLEKEPLPEKPDIDQIPKLDEEDCSDTLTLFHEASRTSISSADKKPSTDMETGNSVQYKENQKLVKTDGEMSVQDSGVSNNTSKTGNPQQSQPPRNFNSLSSNDTPAKQNYPRHVPVHVLDRTQGINNQDISSDMSYQEPSFQQMRGINTNPNNASSSSIYPTFPAPLPLQDNYSICQFSSNFSSLIISNLLQNPAAYAAASFAASFWPSSASTDSAANLSPNVAAVVAATIAAATAWWAAHGLLPPLCPPIHPPGFTSNNTAPKSQMLSSSDSEGSEVPKVSDELTAENHEKAQVVASEIHDSNKTMKSRKLVERSSCGSNTPSSSEVDPDAQEECKKDNEESKELDANHPAGDINNRRGRNAAGMIDSWKEVSEEGRLAFQALFSRDKLPQSFYRPHNYDDLRNSFENDKKKGGDGLSLDLNQKTIGETYSIHRGPEERSCISQQGPENNDFSSSSIKGHNRIGFKPYKRCSVEAKESRMVTGISKGEEKGSKRIRLEKNASAS